MSVGNKTLKKLKVNHLLPGRNKISEHLVCGCCQRRSYHRVNVWYVGILFLPQCVIDTEKQMLVFGTNVREQVQFVKKPFNER